MLLLFGLLEFILVMFVETVDVLYFVKGLLLDTLETDEHISESLFLFI